MSFPSESSESIPTENGKSSVKSSRVSPGMGDPSSVTELAENPTQTLKTVVNKSSTFKEKEEKLTWLRQLSRWKPTSYSDLISSEKNLLALVKTPYKQHRVNLGISNNGVFHSKDERLIHTVEFAHPSASATPFSDYSINGSVSTIHSSADKSTSDNSSDNLIRSKAEPTDEVKSDDSVPVLVMLHGYGAAHGFYFRNYDDLAKHFKVYSIDQLGWGASSRPSFNCKTTQETETWFVESLEEWRKNLNLENFILLGHSFGGYIAARYSIKYPEHVRHLVPVGPAGFCAESERMSKFKSTWQGSFANFLWNTNTTPQTLVRALGPWGKNLVHGYTSNRFGVRAQGTVLAEQESKAFTEYMYHTIAAKSSGENCLKHIFSLGAFARSPLLNSVSDWKVSTSFIYGVDDWMDYHAGVEASRKFPTQGEVFRVPKSGHYVFLDNAEGFLAALLASCKKFLPKDTFQNLKFPPGSYFQVPLTEEVGTDQTYSKELEENTLPSSDFLKGERPNRKVYFSLAKWARDSDQDSDNLALA